MQFSAKTFSDCPDAELVFDEQFVHEVLREVVLRLSAGIREIYGIEPHCDGSGGGTVAVGFRDMGIPAAVWASVVPTYHLANEYSLISRTLGDAQVLARMLFD